MLGSLLVVGGVALLLVAPWPALSMLSLGLLAVGFAMRPGYCPPLLAALLPFYLLPKRLGHLAFSTAELVLLAGLIGVAAGAVLRWRSGRRTPLADLETPVDRPIALFLAAALLSLLASEVLRVSLRDLRTLVLEPVAAYYLAAWLLRDRSDLNRLLGGLLLGGGAAALMGLYQYLFTDYAVAVEGVRRMLGPYQSPNHMGLYMGRMLPMAVAALVFLPGARLPAASLVVILGLAQALTFSLGAWLATLLAICGVVVLWRPRATLALAGGVAALLLASVPILTTERIASHFSLTRGTSFIRLQLWESSANMIRDHPLLGVGMDNFLYHYRTSYMLPEALAEPNLSHPHNLVLNFWLQMGFLGVVAAGWTLVTLARVWRRLWRKAADGWEMAILAGIAGAIIDLLAHGMVDNSYFLVDLAFHFWLSAGALVALDRLRTTAERASPPP